MRTSRLLLVMLTLFLHLSASITWAQTISSQKGLTTAIFNTPNGTVKLYLPEDIRAGDIISGTLFTEPLGNSNRQVEKNISQLVKYNVHINGKAFAVPAKQSVVKCILPADNLNQVPLELTGVNGEKIISFQIKITPTQTISLPQNAPCLIPSHALTGDPLRISGSFDGDLSTTNCFLNEQPLTVLAESPRQCNVQYPAEATGVQMLTLKENNSSSLPPCGQKISGVKLEVSAGKLDLRKGQKTYLDVSVSGLQNLPDTAKLIINNETTDVVVMEPANHIRIPLPPGDTGSGIFNRRFNIQSIRTGGFRVVVDLNLPEHPQSTVDTSRVTRPPGYTTKKCDCISISKIEKGTTNGNRTQYKAVVTGGCSGMCGTGINTFNVCSKGTIKYEWTITGDQNAATIFGAADQQTITITEKINNGKYSVKLTATTICDCDGKCESGATIDGPGGTVPIDDPKIPGDEKHPPTQPRDPEQPGETTTKSKCNCNVKAAILQTGVDEDTLYFAAIVSAACKGFYGTGKNLKKCRVLKIEYDWSITAGKDVAVINGAANGRNVKITALKPGMFTLQLVVTVTCTDNSKCVFTTTLAVTVPGDIHCRLSWREDDAPKMNGGLAEWATNKGKNSKTMRRDDFIALSAAGTDYDQLFWRCSPDKMCKDLTGSQKLIPLNGRVRFEWEVESGEGSFVKMGCLPEWQTDDAGDNVIFKPPVIPLAVTQDDTTVTTVIKLFIIDDNPTQPTDETVEKIITVKLTRKKKFPDEYGVEIQAETPGFVAPAKETKTEGQCQAKNTNWDMKKELSKPVISLPEVPDKNIILPGQWIVLEANAQDDPDELKIFCESKNQCPVSSRTKKYFDQVKWEWATTAAGSISDKGRFIGVAGGRYVIYEAPLKMPLDKDKNPLDKIDITIKAKISNPGGKAADTYTDPQWGELKLTIYLAGVKMNEPPKNWVPEPGKTITLKSELMFKNNGWQNGPAHACRVHFFELSEISREKGVCMNDGRYEDKKWEACYDIDLKKEKSTELFGEQKFKEETKTDAIDGLSKKTYCNRKNIYFQARSIAPAREDSITLNIYDYGAYGFARSFANVKTISSSGKPALEEPVYIPIPWTNDNCTRAHTPQRFKKTIYDDNRVTIPLDIDENHVPDGGYKAGRIMVSDMIYGADEFKTDADDQPAGDGFAGDGLSNYEEYRGFMTLQQNLVNATTEEKHTRTDPKQKDIFIRNKNGLDLTRFAAVSDLTVHQITPAQYVSDDIRVVNFNFSSASHVVDQYGLLIAKFGEHPAKPALMGVAFSRFGSQDNPSDPAHRPVPPNWVVDVRIYEEAISKICNRKNLAPMADKMRSVIAHELLHACNVCHHGEKAANPDDDGATMNNLHGLRSGDVACVMRYDNVGTPVDAQCRPVAQKDAVPEAFGNSLCTSATGTGYNTPGSHTERKNGVLVTVVDEKCFGNAAEHRGNCAGQFRVSGKGWNRNDKARLGTPPKACGDRVE